MNRRVTLVLGSGVAWGIAYAGVLKALQELDVQITALGGTSMGALISGVYAADPDTEKLSNIIGEIDAIQIARIFIPTLPHGGLIRGDGVRKFLKGIIGTPDIEDLPLPFFCPATDIDTGEEIMLQDGSLVEAIVSSVSIPILFQPNYYRDRYLVDGGLVDPLPLVCAGTKADPPLAFSVIPEVIRKQEQNPGGIIPFLERLTPHERGTYLTKVLEDTRKRIDAPGLSEAMSGMILISNREVIRKIDPGVLERHLIRLDLAAFGLFDFFKAREIAEEGYRQTIAQRDRVISLIDKATIG